MKTVTLSSGVRVQVSVPDFPQFVQFLDIAKEATGLYMMGLAPTDPILLQWVERFAAALLPFTHVTIDPVALAAVREDLVRLGYTSITDDRTAFLAHIGIKQSSDINALLRTVITLWEQGIHGQRMETLTRPPKRR